MYRYTELQAKKYGGKLIRTIYLHKVLQVQYTNWGVGLPMVLQYELYGNDNVSIAHRI